MPGHSQSRGGLQEDPGLGVRVQGAGLDVAPALLRSQRVRRH